MYVVICGRDTLLGSSSTMIEVDYRMILHIVDALKKGFNAVTVRENDTDDVIILMAYFPFLLSLCSDLTLQIDHSIKPNKTTLNVNNMCANLGMENCLPLLFYHAFSGCDYTPSFFGHGKVSFWDEMIKNMADYRQTFTELSQAPRLVTESQLKVLETYVLRTYG